MFYVEYTNPHTEIGYDSLGPFGTFEFALAAAVPLHHIVLPNGVMGDPDRGVAIVEFSGKTPEELGELSHQWIISPNGVSTLIWGDPSVSV